MASSVLTWNSEDLGPEISLSVISAWYFTDTLVYVHLSPACGFGLVSRKSRDHGITVLGTPVVNTES